MRKRRGVLGAFLFFLFITVLILFAFRTPLLQALYGIVQVGVLPIQRTVHIGFWSILSENPTEEQLEEENNNLREQIVNTTEMKRENKALHDQFETTSLTDYKQIPVTIVGTKGFIPGVSLPQQFIVDKGEKDGVIQGNAVVYKNNLVGKVARVTPHVSLVDAINKQGISLTGRDLKTNALGVIKGVGDGIILDNVVLSDKINIGDIVVAKGDVEENGIGIPPNIVIGKISSIDRRPSNLFQSAEITSYLNFAQLSTLFILQEKK